MFFFDSPIPLKISLFISSSCLLRHLLVGTVSQRFSVFDDLLVLSSTGQICCKMFLSWSLRFFLMVRPGWCDVWRETTELSILFNTSHQGSSCQHDLPLIVTNLITWLRFFLGNIFITYIYFHQIHICFTGQSRLCPSVAIFHGGILKAYIITIARFIVGMELQIINL